MKIRQWELSWSMGTDRRIDMTKLIATFRNFTKALKNQSKETEPTLGGKWNYFVRGWIGYVNKSYG